MPSKYHSARETAGKLVLECLIDSKTIVKRLYMSDCDCLDFYDTCGSFWELDGLGCFKELKAYERLAEMPLRDVSKLAARMYELLYRNTDSERHYKILPKVNIKNPKYRQILNELKDLQRTQKALIAARELPFSL